MTATLTPVPDGEGPQRLSVSQANTFAGCARRWWWKYIAEIDDPTGDDARRGTLVHLVLEHLCKLPPEDRTLNAAARLALEHWVPEPGEAPDPAWLRRLAWRNVTRAVRMPEVVAPTVLATEEPFDTILDGVPFRGYIDRVVDGPDGIEIEDYKDGKLPGGDRSRAEKRRQIILYAAAYEQEHDIRPAAGSLIYTAARVVDRRPVTGQALASGIRWLRKQWDALQAARTSGEFPASPGDLCSWCPAVAHCPEGLAATAARAAWEGKSLGEHGRLALAVEAAAR